MNRAAVIDLGTNTFHLLIAEIKAGPVLNILHEQKQPARLGQGGISQGMVTEEAVARGLAILADYRREINRWQVLPERIFATGTSALRNARNRDDFVRQAAETTGLSIEIISGDREAELIYHGVRAALPLGLDPVLVMDIGGGSVEFILASQHTLFWKQSFEIGGQRLMDKFMSADPMPAAQVRRLQDFLEDQLLPLTNAVHQYRPGVLVGSAGTFDTLVEMNARRTQNSFELSAQTAYELPPADFDFLFKTLLPLTRDGRLALPGMIALRADMIVVACCLVDFVLRKYGIPVLKTSTYALKEGLLLQAS